MGLVRVITQNVDGLHHKAIDNPSYRSSSDSIHSLTSSYQSYLNAPTVPSFSNPSPANNILELHGTLRHAHCLSCQNVVGRDSFQDSLSVLNPDWSQYADQVSQGTREERLNPDGDVELGSGVKYENFVVPNCVKCQGPMKPVRSSPPHYSILIPDDDDNMRHRKSPSLVNPFHRKSATFHRIGSKNRIKFSSSVRLSPLSQLSV